MPVGRLRSIGWARLTSNFPDRELIVALLGICEYGARIGYEGCRTSTTIHPNLPTANNDPILVTADILSELERNRIIRYKDRASLPNNYTASPLGLTDKSDGSKRRIHHLSYPSGDPAAINNGIPTEYGAITYSTIEEAVEAIQYLGRDSILIKRDFESAFRHIPVSPLDSPLLGFQWKEQYYSELYLPFGLRTAPYLFNLFAEVFHWILETELSRITPTAKVIHYLDDFLIVLPSCGILGKCTELFSKLSEEVGLSVKESKSEEGVRACFGGVEFDTARMVIRLPASKILKARNIVQELVDRKSVSLHDLQRITGYLNFISVVIPLGRTFLRRLYNMELYFPPGSQHIRRRMSREAKKDLIWWSQILEDPPERLLSLRERDRILAWSDASSTKGLGGYYIRGTETHPGPESAFAISSPSYLAKAREHINTQEMRAVEQVLLYWGALWKGKSLLMHTDNRAVAHALTNRTIRGAAMEVLRRCLLLAAEHDLEVEARWITTKDNALADALSRLDYGRIADIAPQLISPTCTLQQRGFLIYRKRVFQPAPPTTSGAGSHQLPDGHMTPRGHASQSFAPSLDTGT